MSGSSFGKGSQSLTQNVDVLRSRISYLEQGLSVVYDHIEIDKPGCQEPEEPTEEVRFAFDLRSPRSKLNNVPTPSITSPRSNINTSPQSLNRQEKLELAEKIAEKSIYKLIDRSRNNTPNPNNLPRQFANLEKQRNLNQKIKILIYNKLVTTLNQNETEELSTKISDNLSKHIKNYQKDGLHLKIKDKVISSSMELKADIEQAFQLQELQTKSHWYDLR